MKTWVQALIKRLRSGVSGGERVGAGADGLPVRLSSRSYAGTRNVAMRELGFDVQWHDYPMQHAVCAEEIRDLGDWMSARFAAG